MNFKLPPVSVDRCAAAASTRGSISRRAALSRVATGAAGTAMGGYFSSVAAQESRSAMQKVQIIVVGTANRALSNIRGVEDQDLIALCDVDRSFLNERAKAFPAARLYADYREMIDQESGRADAIVVSNADHHHAPAAMRGIQNGLHCYCEKPLSHTVAEARSLAEAAAKHDVATQMGTQIHAGENYRRVVEVVRSGAIGDITRVHVWVGKGWGGGDRPATADPVPAHLDWDLWLGPAPRRPYAKGRYHPAQWRRWWDFGQGTLGDMGCHYMDLPFWALDLTHPTTCVAEGPAVHAETCPVGLRVTYQFPAVGDRGPVEMVWYDGNRTPAQVEGIDVPKSGVMFVGTEGNLYANYSSYKLYPEERFTSFTPPPPTIENSIGHHAEWIRACRESTPTTCNFAYSGRLTEAVLLGNVAYRAGQEIQWEAATMTVPNSERAQSLIRKSYREGWSVDGAEDPQSLRKAS